MKVENVLVEKAEVEKKSETQRLAKKEGILVEVAEDLTKKIPDEESPESKRIRDQSCRSL